MTEHTQQNQGRVARGLTLTTTYGIKLVGLASAFNQLLLQPNPRAFPLAVAAFMMAGAQLSEGLLLSFLDRVMVDPRQPESEPEPKPKPRARKKPPEEAG